MLENPCSLEELCLDTVCDNILNYVEVVPKTPTETRRYVTWLDESFFEGDQKKYKFKDDDLFLINEISERLLQKFIEKNILCDALLNIFNEHNTKLKSVRMKNCKITIEGLRILRGHKISELECVNIKNVCILDILDCLSEWSAANISHVNFSNGTFITPHRHNLMVRICNLKNLRSLNLADTELNQTCFTMICEDLKLLEKLDISGTYVTDLQPLTNLSTKLAYLAICDLPNIKSLSVLQSFLALKHLDVGLIQKKVEYEQPSDCPLVSFLENNVQPFPNLVSFDVSGWCDLITTKVLLSFILAQPKLQYLGFVSCAVAFEAPFSDEQHEDYPKHLIIAGLGNESQIKVTLKKYKDRSTYAQKALYYLFRLTNSSQEARSDMFNLVLPVMEAHSTKFGVQMAATACLYNLTRGDLSKSIHPRALSKGVALTLYAMGHFPTEFQLQKNSLLTLCSDRILQEVNFDRFQCARRVLDALCAFEEVNMNRMAVAICSILASKISTKETSELGARPYYMNKLLSMVQSRVDSRVSDITLKFTLSALWNLTDESAPTCRVFLEQGGACLFLNLLKTFKNDSAIETKVLGLFNNIAEVARLRHSLMLDSLMNELFTLLKSENIDVSYFAAGIVAHLASDGEKQWIVSSHSREEMLLKLESAVMEWEVPESEMVAYRSFKPFFPLLGLEMDSQVQLWAVWAIHHVCTKNPKRYCMMLKEEKGHDILNNLIKSVLSHNEIKHICSQIMDTLYKTLL